MALENPATPMLRKKTALIFDLDGTLTRAVHDFPDIRRQLDIPADTPILEYIDQQPRIRAGQIRKKLDLIEQAIANESRASPGAKRLLSALQRSNHRIGVLTRNSQKNALATLDAAGLLVYFQAENVFSRDSAAPKPKPDGIHLILQQWQVKQQEALIIGDFRYDMEAGRAAGISTVYFDCQNENRWNQWADIRISDLNELIGMLDI